MESKHKTSTTMSQLSGLLFPGVTALCPLLKDLGASVSLCLNPWTFQLTITSTSVLSPCLALNKHL